MESNEKPRVSAVIPAYNAAPFIARAVESVLAQTYPVVDVLVVDDGSKDDTAQVVSQYGPPVRLLRQKNQGPGAARNHGVREAQGDWIALLDADDAWLPQKIERQVALTCDPAVGIVHAWEAEVTDIPDEVTFDRLWERNCIANSAAMIRRSAWEAVGGCDEDPALISVEDYNLWLRLAAAGWKIVTCRDKVAVYISEPGHLTGRFERYAQAEVTNVERIGSRLKLAPDRIEQKRIVTYDEQGRLLLYHRRMAPARRLLFQALKRRPSPARLKWWLAACLPPALLDARRAAPERPHVPPVQNAAKERG